MDHLQLFITNKNTGYMEWINAHAVLNSVLYSLIGIVMLVVCFYIIERITPENLYKEVVDKHNTALAIVAGAFMIAVAMIISSAIH